MSFSEEQKREWREQVKRQKTQMESMVRDLAESYQENPENIAELLEFGSRFYKYSVRNNMLLYTQNPGITYVQSFKAWKSMGVSVKKGEQGLKVYVPVKATILKVGTKLVPLEYATKEQKIAYQAGEIDSITQTHFNLGTVFDISQTNYPKELYPKLFFMGYSSELHHDLMEGLKEYAEQYLGYSVEIGDMKSIAIRGSHNREEKVIRLNEQLEDTQNLSTLAHELGHALIYQEIGKSTAQKELEADAVGIMLEAHFNIEPTDSRKRHLAQNYRTYQEEYAKVKGLPSFGQILTNVYDTFKNCIPDIDQVIEQKVKLEAGASLQPLEIRQISQQEVYEQIKQQVRIVDYASAHYMEVQRKGRYFSLKEYDSVRIDPDKNCFWRNSGIGNHVQGSVIDFALEFVHDGDMKAALSELSSMINFSSYQKNMVVAKRPTQVKERASLVENLPMKDKNMRRVYAYLIKSRYLDQDVVQEFTDKNMLYQDIKGNCVFVSYDEKGIPNYAAFRGTLTDRKFLGDVPGNDYSKGFYINNHADQLIVSESVIDAMSIMSILKGQGIDYHEYDYFMLTGTGKYEPILQYLQEAPKSKVLLSLDHDVAGVETMAKMENYIKENGIDTVVTYHVPASKDWNQDLTDAGKRFQKMDTIPYLEEKELPRIHICAVQSTEQIQESGFRIRENRHQYRLVELLEDGTLQPVKISERNTLYFSAEEVKKLVPNMYKLVNYSEIERLQKELQPSVQISGEEIAKGNDNAGIDAPADKDGQLQPNQAPHAPDREMLTSGIKDPEKGLNGLSKDEIESSVFAVVQAVAEEKNLDVEILAVRVYGERTREGLYQESSDVNVVLYYRGEIEEDNLFWELNQNAISFRGMELDMNPIRDEQSGNLASFMERNEQYLNEQVKLLEQGGSVEKIKVSEYFWENGCIYARGEFRGEEIQTGVWKRKEQFYIVTGLAMDNSLQEHMMSESEVRYMIKETGISREMLSQMPDDGVIWLEFLKTPKNSLEDSMERKNAAFLKQIGKQEYQKSLSNGPGMRMPLQIEL